MANLVELFDNIVQMQNLNGVPLAAGKLYVYALGRTRLMDTWSDVDGESLNPNPIILDDAGQAHVYVSDDFDYTLVVCDQYNNEIFSLDKYLYSKGSHSHADVAVAPSETIGVSSYHVGETTVYVPYLTGQLGKVYEGIDPIVVNNQVDKISANHVPLGVQDPLYFVQDDEEGCIIGCSAQTEIPSALSGKWDEASDVVIANSAQWAEGTTYEAGSYVDIDGHTINVTGLQPAGNYQSAGDYVVHDELSSYATQDWVENQSYMKEYMESAFYPSTSNPSGYLTEHQSLDGLMSADLLEISDNKITGYNGTAFAGQGGEVSGDFRLVEGNGIQLTDDPIAQTTTISVSGDYATQEDIESATSGLFPSSAVNDIYTGIFANTVNYLSKPSADAIYASYTTLANVGQIVGLNNSNFYIVPSGTLQIPNIITATTGVLKTQILSADYRGLVLSSQYVNFSSISDGLINSGTDSYFSAGKEGLYNSGNYNTFSANTYGVSVSGGGTYFSAGKDGVYNIVNYNPSLFISGLNGKIDINLTGGSAVDGNGNKKWQIGEADHLWSFAGGNPSYTGQPIVLCYAPQTGSASAPYFKAGPGGITSEYTQNNATMGLYGDFGAGIRYINQSYKITATLNANDVQYSRYNTVTSATDIWSLTGSVQKREIECDTATSAITAIAGSAIGGGGGVPQSAFDELKQSYDALSALFAQYSGQWLLPNEGEE